MNYSVFTMGQSTHDRETTPRTRVLLVAPDVVGARMAGPGLRFVSIARALAPYMHVTLAAGVEGSSGLGDEPESFDIAYYTERTELEELVAGTDVIFCQFFDTHVARMANEAGVAIVYDLYNALPVETIGSQRISGFTDEEGKDREYSELVKYFAFCARAGSYFVTSNERQRDWWLGFIMASLGVLPSTLHGRKADEIIGLLPFGSEDREPELRFHGLRGRHGIDASDFIVLWAGGIWDWFDAATPIRAIASLVEENPRIKLVFYGTTHPNASIGEPATVREAKALAEQLGVLGNVVFLDDWVPAAERENYLLDADIAISTHQDSLETHYAFRTRILDHFWARLPSVVSRGDWFAQYIDENGLGTVTDVGDVEGVAAAIRAYSFDEGLRMSTVERIETIRAAWTWSETTRELRELLTTGFEFIRLPQLAPEAVQAAAASTPIEPSMRQIVRMRLVRSPIGPVLRRGRAALRRVSTRQRRE
jgi:glycosyltransferase involved in cell wall biosynthesis